MKQSTIEHETWLDLSHAADYLGVHFTTLRRWADAGELACIRTPGGRRRFTIRALDDFLARSGRQGDCGSVAQKPQRALAAAQPLQDLAINHTRASIHSLPVDGSFLARMSDEQRLHLRGTGQRLTALLLQYNSRSDCCDAFLEEGRRIAREYSLVCRSVGLSVQETTQVFLFFRRSILDAVHETAYLGGRDDPDGLRLYSRSTDFLDQLLLDLIGSYMEETA